MIVNLQAKKIRLIPWIFEKSETSNNVTCSITKKNGIDENRWPSTKIFINNNMKQ